MPLATPPKKMSFRDIKQVVLDRIQDGTWPADSTLPTEVEMATEFSSTRTTVNRALRELADEGYLERKRKAGTRVLPSPTRSAPLAISFVRTEVAATGARYRYSLVERALKPAPSWLASRLDLPHDQEMLFVRCMHYADTSPFQLEDRWIAIDAVPNALDESFEEIGPNEWLIEQIPFTSLELNFSATKADQPIAEFLDAQIGDPIFTAERFTWFRDAPVTHAKMYFAPGYKMTTRLS